MKRPIAIPALLFGAGIAAGAAFDAGFSIVTTGALAALALACVTRSRLALGFLIVACGWAHLSFTMTPFAPNDLRAVVGLEARIVEVRGTLAETPAQRLFRKRDAVATRSFVEVQVTEIMVRGEWVSATGAVMLFAPDALPAEWTTGQGISAEGVLATPREPEAPGLFDYRKHLRWKGIYYTLTTESADAVKALPSEVGFWAGARRSFIAWSKQALGRGFDADDEMVRLVWAMTLGWTTGLTNEVSEPFVRSGTLHVFAISGMHIAVLTIIFAHMLRLARVPRQYAAVITIVCVWCYTLATGGQASAVRSAIMSSVILAGWVLRRPSDLVNSLFVAALLILLLDPRQLFLPGFQLSFLVVLALAMLVPPLTDLHDRHIHPDPLLAEAGRTLWHRVGWACERGAALAVIVTVAAWVGSLLITAFYFNVLSPISLLANLVIVPLSNGALACALGSLFFAGWWGWMSEVFNHAAWGMMTAMVRLSEWSAELPGAYWNVRSPGVVMFTMFYVALAALLGRVWRFAIWRWAIAAALLVMLMWEAHITWSERATLEITCLPGDGGGLFVREGGTEILIDCGSDFKSERLIKPFLQTQGVDQLDALVLTHGDAQHLDGYALVAREFNPAAVVTSDVRFRSSRYRAAVADLEQQGRARVVAASGTNLGWGRTLHPAAAARVSRADDGALVFALERHGKRVLLLGDLGRRGQEELLNSGAALKSDVLILTGSTEQNPLLEPLLSEVGPKFVVMSPSNFGSRRGVQRLEKLVIRSGAQFLNTEDCGAVTIRLPRTRSGQIASMRGPRAGF